MKLIEIEVTNFASYELLSFDFQNQGLTLIHGETGSGKSTLLDAVMWVLFGVTAKDGKVDDVRRWQSDEKTEGKLTIQLQDKRLTITRIRGKPSENDLYWVDDDNNLDKQQQQQQQQQRGKDLSETQSRLEEILGGITHDAYNIAAYYHEYSPTRNFFDANAKTRRELFETIADLSFPAMLTEKAFNAKKETKKEYSNLSAEFNQAIGNLGGIRLSKSAAERDSDRWEQSRKRIIDELLKKSKTFDQEKEKKIFDLHQTILKWDHAQQEEIVDCTNRITHLSSMEEGLSSSICPTCGSVNKEAQKRAIELSSLRQKLENIGSRLNPHISTLENVLLLKNNTLDLLENEKKKENPFLIQIDRFVTEIKKLELQQVKLKTDLENKDHRLQSLTYLQELCAVLRSKLLQNVIKEVQDNANGYLETYFDSAFKIHFELDDSDNLNIEIFKDGYSCVFRQLSKGQKCLLKLCFAISVMKSAANKIGNHFDTLFFDEALDGLDEALKMKAFYLFSELEKDHGTIFVIDHNTAFQALFNNIYYIAVENDTSVIMK